MPIQYTEYETPQSPYNTLNENDLSLTLIRHNNPNDTLTSNLTQTYLQYLEAKGVESQYVNEVDGFESAPNMTEYLSLIGEEDRGVFRNSYVTAASFISGDTLADDVTIVSHFNNEAFHTPPLAVNVISNTLLW